MLNTWTTTSIMLFLTWTFSWCIAHSGPAWNFSFHAVSATGGWQTLHHCWTCHTLVCRTYAKNSTAELLTVNWILDSITANLLLGFSTTTGSDRRWSSILDSDPISVWRKVPSAGISRAVYFWFPIALPEYLMGGSELSDKCMNFWNCLHKINWVTMIVQEMRKSTKGSLKLLYLLMRFLCC